MSNHEKIHIDVPLVRYLIVTQFPKWADLEIKPVEFSGWDNKTFHLGKHMTVRLPSHAEYAAQVSTEQYWGYDEFFMKKFMSAFGLTELYLNKGMTFIAIEKKSQ